MKAVYVTSLDTFSGKTALCLGLAHRFRAEGYRVGYFKPLSTTARPVKGKLVDEDAAFARELLGLQEPLEKLAPVLITPEGLEAVLTGKDRRDWPAIVRQTFAAISRNKDVVMLEGGARLREGYAVGLGTPDVVAMLGASALAVVRYTDEHSLVDDCLVARRRLGEALIGVVFNAIPRAAWRFANEVARPFLEQRGIPVLGVLPHRRQLQAISVGELREALEGEFLCLPERADELVENLMVGAMTVDAALSRFRRQTDKAVITGGDRSDIQLAALETATKVLILTGNLHPSPIILERAREAGVPVILTSKDTLKTVEAIERFFGKTRLGQRDKLARFEALLAEHFDFQRFDALLAADRVA